MTLRDDYWRRLRSGGLALWAMVGLPVFFVQLRAPAASSSLVPLSLWTGSFLLFGVAFWLATRQRGAISRGAALALAAVQTVAVMVLFALPPCFGLEGALLVLVAFQLGHRLDRLPAVAWIAVQTAGLLVIMWLHWGWHWGVVLAFAYLPFQLIADATTRLLAEETAARDRLSAANAELVLTHELLDQSVRIGERARIAQDLHDVLGHHLTALSLNLEIASHLTSGDARARVETAQSVTKLLLGDVRSVVEALSHDEGFDLPAALGRLAAGIPRPRVHVDVASDLVLDRTVTGEVLLRCAQEIVTNAVRHAGADNVWLAVVVVDGSVEIRGRDDGHGAASVRTGRGLSGLRERFEQQGGAFAIDTAPGRGFSVRAMLPLPGSAS